AAAVPGVEVGGIVSAAGVVGSSSFLSFDDLPMGRGSTPAAKKQDKEIQQLVSQGLSLFFPPG
ncbi:unnamed protein product, partial [Amoebophrya sp. A120]